MAIGIRRIRSFVPPVLAAPETEHEELVAAPAPSPPKRQRKKAEVPVLREEALGVHFQEFKRLPPEVWNQVVGGFRAALGTLCRALENVYQGDVEQQLEHLLDREIPDVVYALGRDVIEGVLQRERGFLGSRLSCDKCRGELKFEGNKRRAFRTRMGRVVVHRAYYHCRCGHTVFPLDEVLGLQEHDALPSIQEEIAFLAADLSYEKAVETVARLLPVTVCSETAQRITATVASRLQAEQEADRDAAFRDPANARLPEPATIPTNSVAVVAVDGGMCRIRDKEQFSEFKVGVLGTLNPAKSTPKQPAPVEDKHYVAHFADADAIFEYVALEYHRLGLHLCPVLHLLGDGAVWIWSRGRALLQPGQEYVPTLDFYHATEHACDLSKALFGADTPEAKAWARTMEGHLYEGRLDDFFAELRRQLNAATANIELAESVQAQIDYFEERREMLNYAQCRQRGLPIGSGIVEGGVRFVGKDRLHGTGMRWLVTGAEAVLQVRATNASGERLSFSQRQASKRREAFNAYKTAWLRCA